MISERWQTLNSREKGMLMLMLVIVSGTMYWLGVWKPLESRHQQTAIRLERLREQEVWMDRAREILADQRKGDHSFKNRQGRSLLALIMQTAELNGVGIFVDRAEPVADGKLALSLGKVSFDLFYRWCDRLRHEYGIMVDQIQVDSTGLPGEVSVRVVFADTAEIIQ